MRGIICAVFLAACISTPASAEDGYPIWGIGARTCSKFVETYKEAPDSMKHMVVSWAQGYVTGVNMMAMIGGGDWTKRTKHLSHDQIWNHIRSECQQKPLKRLDEVVFSIMGELPK